MLISVIVIIAQHPYINLNLQIFDFLNFQFINQPHLFIVLIILLISTPTISIVDSLMWMISFIILIFDHFVISAINSTQFTILITQATPLVLNYAP